MGLRRARRVAGLALLALLAAGCTNAVGSTSGSSSPSGASSTVPIFEKGGTVAIAVPSLPTQFNPSALAGSNAITQEVMEQVWPQLFVENNELSVQPNPALLVSAEVVSISPQQIVYTINKRADWSDGVPITAADFIYDWHEQEATGASLPAVDPVAGYDDIASIKSSADGKTATVTFITPYRDWKALFNNLVPAHIAQRYGWAAAFARFDPARVVSGGAFELAREVSGKEIVLDRNPSYWGTPATISRIVFRVEPTDAATIEALRSGTVQIGSVVPSIANQEAIDDDIYLRSSTVASDLLWQLDFNLADPTLSILAVRQGIAAAIDRYQLISNTVGLSSSYNSLVDNRLYPFAAPYSQGDGGNYDEPDLTEANAFFTSAGFTTNSDGVLESAAHKPMTLSLVGPANDPIVAGIESQLQAQLLQVGIVLTVHNVALNAMLADVLPKGAYQLAIAPYLTTLYPSTTAALYTEPVGPEEPQTPTTTTTTLPVLPVTTTPGEEPGAIESGAVSRDVLGLDDPRLVSLFAAASSDLNQSSSANLYNEIDTELWSLLPTLPLFQQPVTTVSNIELVNVFDSLGWAGPLWNAENWAIELNPPLPTTTIAG